MDEYAPLLTRQIKKYLKKSEFTDEWKQLLDAINRSYQHFERDHLLAMRSLELSSAEMRKMNIELLQKEEIFRQFAENSLDMFWMISADLSQTIFMSPNKEKILSIEGTKLPDSFQEWLAFIHPEDKEYYLKSLKAVASTARYFEMEYRVVVLEKPVLWIRDRAFQVKDENGVVSRIGGMARNVTPYKKTSLIKDIRHKLAILLEESKNIETTAPKILEMVCSAFGWKIGIFWEVHQDSGVVHYLTSWYQDPNLKNFNKACEAFSFWPGFSLAGKILTSPVALLVRQVNSVPDFKRKEATQKAGLRDYLGIPIQIRGKRYGVIEFFHTDLSDMDNPMMDFFNDMAKQIGLFIERKQAEQALLSSEARFRNTFEHAAIGIALLSLEGKFIEFNQAFCEMLSLSKEELEGKSLQEITFVDDLNKEATYQKQLLAGELPSFHSEKRFVTSSKEIVWTLTSTSLVKNTQGSPMYFIYEVQDISQRKYIEEKLFHLAYYDLLTSLPNKRLVEDTLNQSLLTSSLMSGKVAVIFIKINRFSRIKDTLGPAVADLLIKQIALRLQDRIAVKDLVGRWGEYEFVLVTSHVKTKDSASLLAQKILSLIKEPCFVEERKFYLTASIGISIFPEDADQVSLLCIKATLAMNNANLKGRDNFEFFNEKMLGESQEKLTLETHLRKAIALNELQVHYQPIINIDHGKITAVEALLRWNSAALGPISPAVFIPLAEEIGLISTLGEWVLINVCKDLKNLEQEGYPRIIFDVNVSALQLKEHNFIKSIKNVLSEYQLDPNYLMFEIIESQLMENAKETIKIINELRDLKIQIAIDDFGVGFSSFNYLRQFSFDRFKIDASFIRNIHIDPRNRGIVSAILAMSQALSIPSVAEGVETQEELAFLKTLGCQEIQGFYFSKPLPLEELKIFLNEFSLSNTI
jgi:diguanylate cyclase (GGDEF)-like protein/PAS domain S-box-containing protein